MRITKHHVIELLRARGDAATADRAARELPDDLTFSRDRQALERLGVDPTELIGKVDGAGIPGLS